MTTISQRDLLEPVTSKTHTDFSRLYINQTIDEALAAIRQSPPSSRIIYFYVVDEEDRLHGIIPTRRLLLGAPDELVSDIMVRNIITIPHTATILDACEFFVLHRLLAFPVVDDERRIIGIVDVELYTSGLSELGESERNSGESERNDDLFQLIGVHLTQAEQASSALAFRRRFPWLLVKIISGILAAFLTSLFEAELQEVMAIAFFIPVILILSESVCIQSLSVAPPFSRSQVPTLRDLLSRLRAEASVGAMLGGVSGLIVVVCAMVWLNDWRIAACLFGGVGAGVVSSALIGAATPFVMRMLRSNQRVAAGPLSLAVADIAALLIYFSLARWLYSTF